MAPLILVIIFRQEERKFDSLVFSELAPLQGGLADNIASSYFILVWKRNVEEIFDNRYLFIEPNRRALVLLCQNVKAMTNPV